MPSRNVSLLVLGLVGGVGALGYLASHGEHSRPAQRTERAAPQDVSRLARLEEVAFETRRQVAELQTAQLALNQQPVAAPSLREDPPTHPLDPSTADGDEKALDDALVRERENENLRFTQLSKDLDAQIRDAGWAREVENAYRGQLTAMAESGPKPDSVAIECRTDLCRVELHFASEDDARRHRPSALHHPSIAHGTSRIVTTTDGATVVAFTARAQRTLLPPTAEATPN